MRRMSVSVESSTVAVFRGVKVITVLEVVTCDFDAVVADLSICPGVEIVVVVRVSRRCRGRWRTTAQG
jgi:hypothetical protein